MTSVSAVSHAVTATTAPTTSATTAVTGPKTLGQDDFLKLLAQQFQSQDPMKPVDDTQFIAQMAQFTSLQQTSTMSKDIGDLKAQQQLATANSYLGHHVTVDIGNGQSTSGDVTAVQMVDGAPQLVVGGNPYAVSSVLLVEPGAVSSSSTSTNASTTTTP